MAIQEKIEESLEEESQKLIDGVLEKTRRMRKLRITIVFIVVCAILAVAGHFVLKLIPRKYKIRTSGGEILLHHHYLATLVRNEVADDGVNMIIEPTSGSFESLKRVSEGSLDMAFIQGGLDKRYPNVLHAATLQPEALHFLAKPGINNVSDIKGKVVNLGAQTGGTWVIAKKVLEFSGMIADVDYIEMNRTNEKLANMHPNRLPDVIAVVSCVPSYLAEFLVKDRGYNLLEIPFPTSLAYRYGWVAEITIPDYTYNVNPPVPEKEIKTVGVKMQLIANEQTPKEAIQKVLNALCGPELESKTHFKLDEPEITSGAFFPISQGTLDFLERNESVFSMEKFEELSNSIGLLMTALSGAILFFKWATGAAEEDKSKDDDDKGEATN